MLIQILLHRCTDLPLCNVHVFKVHFKIFALQQSFLIKSLPISSAVIPKSQLCTLKCTPMFVQSTFYGVCLLYIYKKIEQLANVLMKETGNICMCAVASSAAEVHPTLVQGPVSSHPNLEWQLRTDGPTQTPTGTQTL